MKVEIAIKPPNFEGPGVRAFFTTKHLARKEESIEEALSRAFNVPRKNIYLPMQKHTDKVHILESVMDQAVSDALVTDRENVLIGVLVADCVPVLLHDRKRGIIGAVHAGWRGTAQQILKNTIKIMQERFTCMPEDVIVAIGPSIRQCSYEVDEDVRTAVMHATGEGEYESRRGDKYFIDIAEANKIQALYMKIPPENIWKSGECTYCNPGKYYSYRYAKDMAGRQGGFIGMW